MKKIKCSEVTAPCCKHSALDTHKPNQDFFFQQGDLSIKVIRVFNNLSRARKTLNWAKFTSVIVALKHYHRGGGGHLSRCH